MIRPIDPEKLEATQTRLRESIVSRIPEPKNRSYALALKGVSELRFRNRVFHVPPISYPAGLELQKIHLRLRGIGEGTPEDDRSLRQLLAVLEDAAVLCWKLCRPVSFVDRLFWRWLTNPFLGRRGDIQSGATYQEMGELLGFFFACRTRSSVRLRASDTPTLHARLISPTNWRSSSRLTGLRRG